MKQLFLLMFLFCSLSYGQANLVEEPSIDPQVSEAFENLIKRGEQHQKNYRGLLKEAGLVAIIVVDSLPNGDIGYFERTGETFRVEIPKISLKDLSSLEWTLAHELGHGLYLNHPEPKYLSDGVTKAWSTSIMADEGVIDPTHILYQIMNSEQYSPAIWKEYFDQLKSE